MKSFALLSVRNHPLINHLINQLNQKKSLPKAVIFDKKNLSKDEIDRFCERTGYKRKEIDFFINEIYEIPIFEVSNHNDPEIFDLIDNLKIDFLVNAGTPRILKDKIIHKTQFGILNCHPALLPEYKGCSCVEWSIFHDQQVGNTIHWMNSDIDCGPIIKTRSTKCFRSDRYQDIRKRVYFDGFNLLAELIEEISYCSKENFKKLYTGSIKDGGNYYKPIDRESLDIVKNKIKEKLYKFQNSVN